MYGTILAQKMIILVSSMLLETIYMAWRIIAATLCTILCLSLFCPALILVLCERVFIICVLRVAGVENLIHLSTKADSLLASAEWVSNQVHF